MGSKSTDDVEKVEDHSSKNLYQKLAALSEEIGAIEKDGQAPAQMGGFKFISHGRLMAELRERQKRYGIWIKPEVLATSESRVSGSNGKEGIRIAGEYRFTIINADRPEEREECVWSGEGIDYGDKATQKAGTSAHKYFLMKVYNVSDKDDNDAVPVEVSGNGRRTTSSKIAPAADRAAPINTEAENAEENRVDDEEWAGLRVLARSLPKDKGAPSWFDAKIAAKVRQFGGGSVGVEKVLEELLIDHEKFCGPGCEHVRLPETV